MRTLVMPSAIIALFCACSSSSGSGSETALKLFAGEERVMATVGPEGAQLELKSGARVTIPKGALKEDVDIEVAQLNKDEVGQLAPVDEKRKVEEPLSLKPHGTQFEKEIDVEMPVPPVYKDRADEELRVVVLDDDKAENWTELKTTEGKVEQKKAHVKTRHFSFYAVVPAAPDGEFGGTGNTDAPDTGRDASAGGTSSLGLGDLSGTWISNYNCGAAAGWVAWRFERSADGYTITPEFGTPYTATVAGLALDVSRTDPDFGTTTGTLTFSDDDHFSGQLDEEGGTCTEVGRRAPGLTLGQSGVGCSPPDSQTRIDCDAVCTGLIAAKCSTGPTTQGECTCTAVVSACPTQSAVWQDCLDREGYEASYQCNGAGVPYEESCEPEWGACVEPCIASVGM